VNLQTVRVLLVENDPGDARLLEDSVDGGPFVFTRARTLAEAVERLGDDGEDFDVVLTDLCLPDSDGQATLTRLLEAGPDLPIVVLDSRDDDALALAALDAGAQDYVVKGTIAGAALVRLIRHAIERNGMRQTMAHLQHGREALVSLGQLALEGADLEVVFDAAAQCLHEGIHADLAAIVEAGPDDATVIHRAGSGWSDLDNPRMDAEPDGLANRILNVDETLVVVDLLTDNRFTPPRDLVERGVTSCCLVRLKVGDGMYGFVGVASRDRRRFTDDEVSFVEAVAYVVSLAIQRTTAQRALAERVKEMTALVGLSRDKQRGLPPELLLSRATKRIVWAMTDPSLASAMIELDGQSHTCGAPLPDGAEVLESSIVVDGDVRGLVRVGYREPRTLMPEEDQLVRAIAEQIAFWVQRTESEAQLEASQHRLQSLFDNALDAFLLADDDGRHVEVNAAVSTLTGYTRDELLAMNIVDLVPHIDADATRDLWRQIIAAGEMSGDYEITRKDGRVIKTEFRAVADVASGLHLAVVRDVTQRRDAEERLRESLEKETRAVEELRVLDEMRTGFLQATSHELRTPLTAILGYARTLQRGDEQIAADQRGQFLERLIANGERLQRLIDDLLDLGSAAYAESAMKRVETDLVTLVETVVRRADLSSRAVDMPTGRVVVPVDVGRVERLVEHLIDNAVKHAPAGSHIRLDVTEVSGGALLAVEDDGPGIPAESRAAIFEPFRQGPEMVRHASPGTGIGLALVARIASAHGGRAWVEESTSGGARVCVTLPATLASTSEHETEPIDADDLTTDDAFIEVYEATREIFLADSTQAVSRIVVDLVGRLGAELDVGEAPDSAHIPVDLSLGTGTPTYAVAPPGTRARARLDRYLGEVIVDATRVMERLESPISATMIRETGVLSEELLSRALPRLVAGDVVVALRLPRRGDRDETAVRAFSMVVRDYVRAVDLVFAVADEIILVLRQVSRGEARQFTRRIAAAWAEKSGGTRTPRIGIVAVDDEGGAVALDRARAVTSERHQTTQRG
jgi:PAS domain S-box-containing protein